MCIDHLESVQKVLNVVLERKELLSKVGPRRYKTFCFMRTNFLSDIELRTQVRRKLPVARQYYIRFTVGDTSRSTQNAKETKNRTSWESIFYL